MDDYKEKIKFVKVVLKIKENDYDIELQHSKDLDFINLMESVFSLLEYAKEKFGHNYDEYRETMRVMGILLYGDKEKIKKVKKDISNQKYD